MPTEKPAACCGTAAYVAHSADSDRRACGLAGLRSSLRLCRLRDAAYPLRALQRAGVHIHRLAVYEALARLIYGEARSCCVEEQAAVVWCVLNRMDS